MTHRWHFLLPAGVRLLILLPAAIQAVILPDTFHKECTGTSDGMTMSGLFRNDPFEAHKWYERHYTNCTHVLTNLEITNLNPMNGTSLNVSFLENIREVHGYVLISMVFSRYIPLTSLRVIRGLSLFKPKNLPTDDIHYDDVQAGCSLYVSSNSHMGYGIDELQLPELRDILAGNVRIRGNEHMCFDGKTTINWSYILRSPSSKALYYNDFYENKAARCVNLECHENCSVKLDGENPTKLCWGATPDLCQRVTSVNCNPTCSGRCFGPSSNQCCKDSACAGGCTGQTDKDCWACRNFNNSGQCVDTCPPWMIYDPEHYKMVPNPNVRYTYGTQCLRQCPGHMYADKGNCVRSCGPEHKEVKIGNISACVPCDGLCPKKCPGTVEDEDSMMNYVNSANIANFTNCTIIEGALDINSLTFEGDAFHGTSPLGVEALKALEDVQEITHHLTVGDTPAELKTLSFLRNLRVIRGQKLAGGGGAASLNIHHTQLESLGLVSLKEIIHGVVAIQNNPNLCYESNSKWDTITKLTPTIRNNKDPQTCASSNLTCSNQCNMSRGCWGPGDDQCVLCNGFQRNDTRKCLTSCDDETGLYTDFINRKCHLCHPECKDSCTAGGAENCTACKHVRDGPFCVAECPAAKYVDADGSCRQCHANCNGEKGCSGSGYNLGPEGCNQCANLVLLELSDYRYASKPKSYNCLDANLTECMPGYFNKNYQIDVNINQQKKTTKVESCIKCHPLCKRCDAFGTYCDECVDYRDEKSRECLSTCGPRTYVDNTTTIENDPPTERGICRQCDEACQTCYGPSFSECTSCMKFRIYPEDMTEELLFNYSLSVNDSFICILKCPDNWTTTAEIDRCVPAKLQKSNTPVIVGVVMVSLVIVAVAAVLLIYFKQKLTKAEERKLKLRAQLSGLADPQEFELSPSNVKPDMSRLRICKESELRQGQVIGAGAFGTVYKGVFIPERENVKIPVAIKELSEAGSNPHSNNELLEEARIMAAVVHPCCIRIMAVCLTKQMMLITPLMPLGSLLDYLHRNRSSIGSRSLLLWAQQIADGMNYLESLAIVHRDLAARNVLVHSPSQLKITDFGLAKLLASDEYYLSTGGKLPVKWLALECIQHRLFTHKSDVWAYGVTLWELFTFGQKPYEEIRAVEIAIALEKGHRLPQPTICTIDVYMLMIKCWMLDVDSRPTFAELSSEFSKMTKDPARFIVIQDDELLHLPNAEPEWRDLMRAMSITSDGPEALISAEDYLNPQDVNRKQLEGIVEEEYQNTASTFKPAAEKAYCASSAGKASFRSYDREASTRYTSDPCEDEQWPADKPPAPPNPAASNRPEDDGYLATASIMTSPPLLKSATMATSGVDDEGYLDYIGSKSNSDKKPLIMTSRENSQYVDMKSPATSLSTGPIANPEYFNPTPATTAAAAGKRKPAQGANIAGAAEYLNADLPTSSSTFKRT